MAMTASETILGWVREHSHMRRSTPSLIALYGYLIDEGIAPDDAIAALRAFVDDIITLKEQQHALDRSPGRPD